MMDGLLVFEYFSGETHSLIGVGFWLFFEAGVVFDVDVLFHFKVLLFFPILVLAHEVGF